MSRKQAAVAESSIAEMTASKAAGLAAVVALACAGCFEGGGGASFADLALDSIATLGVLEGDASQVFGRIADVEVDAQGRIYVLDSQTPAIRLLDEAGVALGSVTARGEGPGELARPAAIALSADGELRVMDPRKGRIEAFRVVDTGFVHVTSIRPEVAGAGLCRVADRWFTQRITGEVSIHQLADDGGLVRSFAPPLDISRFVSGPVGPLIQETFGSGPFACTAEPAAIVALATALPTVRAYGVDGAALWEVQLADYVPLRTETSAGRGVRSSPAEGTGSHVALGVVPWAAGVLLVQLEIRRPEPSSEDQIEVESRFLSMETGEELHRTRALPHIVAVNGDRVYAIRTDPYPQLRILRRSGW